MDFKIVFQNFLRKVKILSAILIVIFFAVMAYLFFGHYSDGYRGGSLIKISKKGVIFKTIEGQINVGTFLDNGVNKPLSPIWDFSVTNDPKLFELLNHAILTNKRVKLHYQEMYFKFPWRGESLYLVDEVELLD